MKEETKLKHLKSMVDSYQFPAGLCSVLNILSEIASEHAHDLARLIDHNRKTETGWKEEDFERNTRDLVFWTDRAAKLKNLVRR